MTDGPSKADQLLDALVDHWRAQLTGDRLEELIDREIDSALNSAGQLTLDEVVTPEQVTATALKYASQWTIEGSIPELVGEIAARLYEKTTSDAVPLRNILGQDQIQEFAGSLMGLPAFRRLIYESQLTREWAVELICQAAGATLMGGRIKAEIVPGLGPVLSAAEMLMNRFAPDTRVQAEIRIREFAEVVVTYFQSRAGRPLDDSALADAAVDLWAEHADDPMSEIGQVVSPDDIEDFLVLAFEFFFRFRQTEYFRGVVTEGVQYFFEKYGTWTLAALLEDIGVGRADMVEEALRYAPPIIDLLADKGILDDIVRRLHADFFTSERVQQILS